MFYRWNSYVLPFISLNVRLICRDGVVVRFRKDVVARYVSLNRSAFGRRHRTYNGRLVRPFVANTLAGHALATGRTLGRRAFAILIRDETRPDGLAHLSKKTRH